MNFTEEQKREAIECAKVNFENLEKAVPGIKNHPYYKIAKIQLDHGLGYANADFDAFAEKDLGLDK